MKFYIISDTTDHVARMLAANQAAKYGLDYLILDAFNPLDLKLMSGLPVSHEDFYRLYHRNPAPSEVSRYFSNIKAMEMIISFRTPAVIMSDSFRIQQTPNGLTTIDGFEVAMLARQSFPASPKIQDRTIAGDMIGGGLLDLSCYMASSDFCRKFVRHHGVMQKRFEDQMSSCASSPDCTFILPKKPLGKGR